MTMCLSHFIYMCLHLSAEMGGLMGLCLGASLLTMAELLEFLIQAGLNFLKMKQKPATVRRIAVEPSKANAM